MEAAVEEELTIGSHLLGTESANVDERYGLLWSATRYNRPCNHLRLARVAMIKRAEKPSADIEVIPARPEQEPILANLLELYAHDFSEFQDLELGSDGRFGYSCLSLYWSEPGRHPFLVWVEGKLAGLILVKRGSAVSGDETVWDVAEHFVLRGYRRRGIGTQIAHEVWRRFPGLWEVRVMESNVSARDFWAHAISTLTGEAIQPVRIKKDGKWWTLFSFESKRLE
jgi:predicted acetyltransferase